LGYSGPVSPPATGRVRAETLGSPSDGIAWPIRRRCERLWPHHGAIAHRRSRRLNGRDANGRVPMPVWVDEPVRPRALESEQGARQPAARAEHHLAFLLGRLWRADSHRYLLPPPALWYNTSTAEEEPVQSHRAVWRLKQRREAHACSSKCMHLLRIRPVSL